MVEPVQGERQRKERSREEDDEEGNKGRGEARDMVTRGKATVWPDS